MKLINNILKSLLLLLVLSNISFAQESCKGGFCKISLDSLNKDKNPKKVKPANDSSTKNRKFTKTNKVKFASK